MFAAETAVRAVPDKSFYRPGETVRLEIAAPGATRVDAHVTYLAEEVAALSAPVVNGSAVLEWTPPAVAPRGYGLTADLVDAQGRVMQSFSTAFDVLERWTDAPRYGFLSNFSAERADDAATLDWLRRHHINGLQFYDWQYRWEDLLPDADEFDDGLGRPQSMTTVHRLIGLVHSANIQAMPYTAIYGASDAYYRRHPEQALYDATGEPFRLGEDFIVIMDPSPGSVWDRHLLSEFADVLDHTEFDGIHIDQYGAPQNGFDVLGSRVDLAAVMPQFIDQTAALVDDKRGERGSVIFNAVGNWPVETVAPSDQDVTYIEVWPPYNDYFDLHRIIVNAQRLGGKPVVLAAYIPPDQVVNWRLANAIIFASGAYHIETGEPEAILAHPYFPNFGQISQADQSHFQRYYDFIVRYENVLSLADVSDRDDAVDLGEVRTRGLYAKDRVIPIARQGDSFETFSLVNFAGIDSAAWNAPTTIPPTPFESLPVQIEVSRPVKGVWFASPDADSTMGAQPLAHTIADGVLRFELPQLAYWTMVVAEYDDAE